MKILLLGATGLVGSHVLQQALADERVTQVIAPTRQPLNIQHAKLQAPMLDFDDFTDVAQHWQFDAVICALGTTMKKVKSKDAFKQVDYHYPMAFAHLAQKKGVQTYVLNSAMGADVNSPFFYSRVKGQLEQDLKQLGFGRLSFVRPGLITGDRQEFRLGESVGKLALKVLKPITPSKWQPNRAEDIAYVLLQQVLNLNQGINIIDASQIHR